MRLVLTLLVATMYSFIILVINYYSLESENRELVGRIMTPRQFQLFNETYRCFHYPEVKEIREM